MDDILLLHDISLFLSTAYWNFIVVLELFGLINFFFFKFLLTDHCLLGDQPSIAFIGMNCEDLVNNVTAYCYQEKVLARCCLSCAKHYTWKQGIQMIFLCD